jgi:uncharacterized protein YbjT (DUF2867 family)
MKKVLVVGGTGMQGSAVADLLLSKGTYNVTVMSRNKKSDKAIAYKEQGANIVEADLDDYPSLVKAMENIDALFLVINFWTIGDYTTSMDEKKNREINQGINVINAAKEAGVKQIVYSSVGGTARDSHPHVVSKAAIENYLEASGLEYAIFQPVWILENFTTFLKDEIMKGHLNVMIEDNAALQVLAVADLAVFVEKAFANPKEWNSLKIELAGDEISGNDMAAILSDVTSKGIAFTPTPVTGFAFGRDFYKADISHLKTLYPSLLDFKHWADKSALQFSN